MVGLVPCAHPSGPALAINLLRARQRQGVRGHILGDDASRADIGALADPDRRDERAVRADERACANVGLVLAIAIIIAGDRACSYVGARANVSIADIGQVIDLGAFIDIRSLQLYEVPDLGLRANPRPRPEACERTDNGPPLDMRACDMRESVDGNAVLDH